MFRAENSLDKKHENLTTKTYFIGNFDDHFYRIHSYINTSAALGLKTEFLNPVEFFQRNVQLLEHDHIIFNDEPSINYFANSLLKSDEVDPRVKKKAVMLGQFANKHIVRDLFSAEFPHRYVRISRQDLQNGKPLSPFIEGKSIVSKPTIGSCAADVVKFSNTQDVLLYLDGRTDDFDILLEEYVDGQHFCLDVCWSGASADCSGFCWKNMLFDDTPSIVGHSVIDQPPVSLISELIAKFEAVLNRHCSGIAANFHCEFVLAKGTDKPMLIEVNPRGPGGWLPELYTISTGNSYDQNLIKNATGSELLLENLHTPSALGSVVRSDFFEKYLQELEVKSNTLFEQFPKSASIENAKVGRFLIWGDDPDQVQRDYETIMGFSMPVELPDTTSFSAALTSSKCC